MNEAQIRELEIKVKKLENILYGISDDTRFKGVVRSNIIVDYDSSGNPIIIDKYGKRFTLTII